MIRYTLRCDRQDEFEAWFASSDAYDRAANAKANACPICGSTKVEKAIMAPSIGRAGRDAPGATKPAESVEPMTLTTADPKREAFVSAVREFRKKVTDNADYVGPRFADEARKIHYDEAPARGIYGEATPEQARELAEEGVQFAPLPRLPEGNN